MPPLTERNHLIRSQNVSASEVGALMGEHPYMTPERIWDRLVSPFPMEFTANEFMENGTFMEPAIAALAARRLRLRLRANSKTYVHPTVRLCATPDYLVLGTPPGLVEIKLSGNHDMWRSIPSHVEWQVRAQLACTKRETAAVCVLVGSGLRTFLLERDALLEEELLEAVDRFWNVNVVGLQRPLAAPVPQELVMRIP